MIAHLGVSWYPVAAEAEGKRAGLAPTEGGMRGRASLALRRLRILINDYPAPSILRC